MTTTAVHRYRNDIGGEWVEPSSGEYRPDLDPAETRLVLGEFPRSTTTDVDRAVEATAIAFLAESRLFGSQRTALLHKAANIREARAQEIGEVLTREEGKTSGGGVGEVLRGVAILGYFAGEPLRALGEVYSATNPDTFL